MRAELKNFQQELGQTTIYVTHDQVEALSMDDRIAVMNNGILQQAEIYVTEPLGNETIIDIKLGQRICIPMNGVQTTLDLRAGYTGVKKEEIDFLAAVINHMAWFLKIEKTVRTCILFFMKIAKSRNTI